MKFAALPYLKKRISDASIILKILTVYSVLILVFMGSVYGVLLFDMYGLLKNKDLRMEDENLEILERAVRSEYDDLYNIAIEIHLRNEMAWWIRDMLYQPEEFLKSGGEEKIISYMDTLPAANRDLLDLVLIPVSGEAYHSAFRANRNMIPRYDFKGDPRIAGWIDQGEFLQLFPDNPSRYLTSRYPQVISLISTVYDPAILPSREPIAHLLMNLSPQILQRELERSGPDRRGEYFLFNRMGQILFSSSPGLDDFARDHLSLQDSGIRRAGSYLIRTRFLDQGGMVLVNLVSLEKIKKPLNLMILKMTLVALGGFLVALLTAFGLLRLSSRRFFLLLGAFDRVRQGELDIRLPVTVQDEIGRLQAGFNHMCQDLQGYIDRVYAVEIRRKDMENRYLQSQINPHFLYNTLEQMRSRALRTGDAELGRMITLLGELFRWSSRSGEAIVRIEDELEHTSAYLEIQTLRLGDALTVETDMDDSILDAGIPKMILQPLVENAVTHGIEGRSSRGRILMEGRREGEDILIFISDNGRGMDDCRIEEYLDPERELGAKTGGSIGISNVNQRLSLLFGKEYSLSMESRREEGTRVTVRIPRMNLTRMRAYVQSRSDR